MNYLKISNINLLISGQILRKNCLSSFWGGFINIQRQLPSVYSTTTVFSHSWNPEYSALVCHVYGEHDWQSEKQPEYGYDILCSLENADSFEEGATRVGSTWANISFQNVLGNIESRSNVAKNYQPNGDYCLFLRWDFGLSGEYYSDTNSSTVTHQPKEGDVILFPSSLYHKTIPFTTDEDRIVVSFDLMPRNKNL